MQTLNAFLIVGHKYEDLARRVVETDYNIESFPCSLELKVDILHHSMDLQWMRLSNGSIRA